MPIADGAFTEMMSSNMVFVLTPQSAIAPPPVQPDARRDGMLDMRLDNRLDLRIDGRIGEPIGSLAPTLPSYQVAPQPDTGGVYAD